MKRNRSSPPDLHRVSCLYLTDESEYPSNSSNSSAEFSSLTTKSTNKNNNSKKKLDSAFSYVNPQKATNLRNIKVSNSEKIHNFTSNLTFALSDSTTTSTTSTSSFTLSGLSLSNSNKYSGNSLIIRF